MSKEIIPNSLLLLDRSYIVTELPTAEMFFLSLDEADAKALPKSYKAAQVGGQCIRQLLEKYKNSLKRDNGSAEDLLFELFPSADNENGLDFAKLIELANSLRNERDEIALAVEPAAAGEAFFEVLGMTRTATTGEEFAAQERQDVVFSAIVGALFEKARNHQIRTTSRVRGGTDGPYQELLSEVSERLMQERRYSQSE